MTIDLSNAVAFERNVGRYRKSFSSRQRVLVTTYVRRRNAVRRTTSFVFLAYSVVLRDKSERRSSRAPCISQSSVTVSERDGWQLRTYAISWLLHFAFLRYALPTPRSTFSSPPAANPFFSLEKKRSYEFLRDTENDRNEYPQTS